MEYDTCAVCDIEYLTPAAGYVYPLCPACEEEDNARVEQLLADGDNDDGYRDEVC